MLPQLNLQLITCSVHGDIRVWDLKADPMKMELKKQVQQFKTKERFGRPVSLDVGVSTFNKLNRRWKPDVTVSYQYVKASEEKLSIEAFHSFQDVKYYQEHIKCIHSAFYCVFCSIVNMRDLSLFLYNFLIVNCKYLHLVVTILQ